MKNFNNTFFLTITAYILFIENKKSNKLQNEHNFYVNLIPELSQQKINIFLPELDSKLCEEIFQSAKVLCDFEALTFLPDESKSDYEKSKQRVKELLQNVLFNDLFIKYKSNNLFFENWRLLIGMFVTFSEWCDNIDFYKENFDTQLILLKESPLISFNQF
ncbi:hypothetical protein QEJ31_05555 [Pigmentibacter sp. JX0631]|uniref:hypothetical protein n=1 Tax=Pigmentibacter sp. JX0631 TaxID=2976982 RepID=UPI002468E774|nr:hypothetical protein [Pigmentibacter sp. JX0631]WGL61059.1 hypothetical protein QEJ31_05555 [Pigmentibacter sp. JX0631]